MERANILRTIFIDAFDQPDKEGLYRVRLNPSTKRLAAERILNTVSSAGRFESTVVPNIQDACTAGHLTNHSLFKEAILKDIGSAEQDQKVCAHTGSLGYLSIANHIASELEKIGYRLDYEDVEA